MNNSSPFENPTFDSQWLSVKVSCGWCIETYTKTIQFLALHEFLIFIFIFNCKTNLLIKITPPLGLSHFLYIHIQTHLHHPHHLPISYFKFSTHTLPKSKHIQLVKVHIQCGICHGPRPHAPPRPVVMNLKLPQPPPPPPNASKPPHHLLIVLV